MRDRSFRNSCDKRCAALVSEIPRLFAQTFKLFVTPGIVSHLKLLIAYGCITVTHSTPSDIIRLDIHAMVNSYLQTRPKIVDMLNK